ncbi:hypothetical protein ACM6L3_17350 [Paenibacillus larvae]
MEPSFLHNYTDSTGILPTPDISTQEIKLKKHTMQLHQLAITSCVFCENLPWEDKYKFTHHFFSSFSSL